MPVRKTEKKTLEDVPEKLKEEVQQIMAETEETQE